MCLLKSTKSSRRWVNERWSIPMFSPGCGGFGMPMGLVSGCGICSSSSSDFDRLRNPGCESASMRAGICGAVWRGLGGGGCLGGVLAYRRRETGHLVLSCRAIARNAPRHDSEGAFIIAECTQLQAAVVVLLRESVGHGDSSDNTFTRFDLIMAKDNKLPHPGTFT